MSEATASVELKGEIAELSRLAAFASQFAAAHGMPADEAGALALSLEEAVTNVIVHGYKEDRKRTVCVRFRARAGEIQAEIEDDAPPFDPLDQPAPALDVPVEERQIGGLGIHLVRNLMDAVEYRRADGKNRLTLTKRWQT